MPSGLERLSARPRGGVVKVELAEVSAFADATYDSVLRRFTAFPAPEVFAEYVFREDCAGYVETLTGDGLVRHTLTMELPFGDAVRRRAVDELLAGSGSVGGIVAIVTLASGERLLAGWSARFGVRYPLRVAKAKSGSGAVPADVPSVAITLESEDADPSLTLV